MMQVYLENLQNNNNITFSDTAEICRFCMKPITDFFALDEIVDEYFFDMLQKFLPEVTLHLTSNPVSCSDCLDSLKSYLTFLKCLQYVEEHINSYCEDESEIKRGKVALNNVALYILQKISKGCEDKKTLFNEDQLLDIYFSGLTITKKYITGEGKIRNVPLKETTDEICLPETYLDSSYKEDTVQNFIKIEEIEIKTEETVESNVERRSNEATEEEKKAITNDKQDIEAKSNMNFRELVVKLKRENFNSCLDCGRFMKGQYMIRCDRCTLKIIVNHEGDKRFNCAHCEFSTNHKRCLLEHMMRHAPKGSIKKYKCEYCSHESIWKTNLMKHQMMHLKQEGVGDFKCDNCPFKSKYKSSLQTHKKMCLLKNSAEIDMFTCTQCSYATVYKHCLKKHMMRHAPEGSEKKFKCDYCSYETNLQAYLRNHQRKHHLKPEEVKVYKCDDCLFQTKSSCYFSRHKKLCRLPSYKSKICRNIEKTMQQDDNQTQSKETPHPSNKEFRFKCDYCDYKTNKNDSMTKHLVTHKSFDEVELFTCAKCRFTTKHKHCLTRHMLTHRSETVPKKFKCEQCGHQTHRNDEMKVHKLIHKSDNAMHKCENCMFKTKYKPYLDKHKKFCKKVNS